MGKLTWRELLEFLNSESFTDDLDSLVYVYDMQGKQETPCDIIEIKNDDDTWSSFIGINLEDISDEN